MFFISLRFFSFLLIIILSKFLANSSGARIISVLTLMQASNIAGADVYFVHELLYTEATATQIPRPCLLRQQPEFLFIVSQALGAILKPPSPRKIKIERALGENKIQKGFRSNSQTSESSQTCETRTRSGPCVTSLTKLVNTCQQ